MSEIETVKIIGNICYVVGTRERYKELGAYDDKVLYWCEDTRELFKGVNSYSEGVRHVDDHLALSAKAQGVIYMEPNGAGFVYDHDSEKWEQVIYPITTVIDETSTNDQIPTAKAVYNALQAVQSGDIDLSDYVTKIEMESDLTDIRESLEQLSACCTWGTM